MSPTPRPNALPWLLLSAAVVLLDQQQVVGPGQPPEYTPVPVIEGFWNWYRTYNTGAAFSFLATPVAGRSGSSPRWRWHQRPAGVLAMRTPRGDWRTALPFSLVIGGALGNVIDRQLHGHVVDFIQWHWRDYYWRRSTSPIARWSAARSGSPFGLFRAVRSPAADGPPAARAGRRNPGRRARGCALVRVPAAGVECPVWTSSSPIPAASAPASTARSRSSSARSRPRAPIYVRHEAVHNRFVVEDRAPRAIFVEELDEVPDGSTVIFSAHGVSRAVREEASGAD